MCPNNSTPIELLKGRLQIQYELKASDRQYSGPIDCAKKLIKNNGIIGGLYKGFVPNVMFRSFFWVLWGSFEIYRSLLVEIGLSRETISFVAGGLAANTFWTIAYPFGKRRQ